MKEMCVSVDLVYVLVEMWPLSTSIVTSRKLIDVVKLMLLRYVYVVDKLCKRSNS